MPSSGLFQHCFEPVYDRNSTVLILGTFPSKRSRADGFYYSHPRNRFWPLLAAICSQPLPLSPSEKRALLIKKHIALYDAAFSCYIEGSSDSSIKNVIPTDLNPIFKTANIRAVAANGKKAAELYARFNPTLPAATVLPSTSPANAAWTMDMLIKIWSDFILPYLSL